MPKKIRQLKAMLQKAGFSCRSGKGNHSVWTHPRVRAAVVLSGNDGRDARRYQEEEVNQALAEAEQNQ